MQLIPQEEQKQRLIYKVCLFFLILFFVLLAALFLVLAIYPHDRWIQNVVGFTFMVSCLPVLIVGPVMQKLNLKKHYVAGSYSLPYKLHKEIFYPLFFVFCAMGLSLLLYSSVRAGPPSLMPPLMEITGQSGRIFSIPGWVIFPVFIWLGLAVCYFMISWNGIVLHTDHFVQYTYWIKKSYRYADIISINIKRISQGRSRLFVMIVSWDSTKAPLTIYLTPIPAKDVIIMLTVIHQQAPDAVMNELAGQMRQGDFSVT